MSYKEITAEKAKVIMDTEQDYVILDVREDYEYAAGHIPGAMLLSNEEIGTEEIELLPDKEQLILVYCRSGYRSKLAAEKLDKLGYQNIYEFGGIIDWTYDIEGGIY